VTRSSARRTQIAVVMYPGLLPLELIGTVSALDGLGLNTGFRPVTVAACREPLATDTPLRVVPQSTFAAVPRPAALLVVGGSLMATIGAMGDERLLAYVRAAAASADLVASVGTGALILAAAGLLTGKRATTHRAYRRLLEQLGATYVPERWVEDGKYLTAGGASGGIDLALHLVAKRKSERTARRVQLWIEYDPQPPFGTIDWQNVDEDALAHVFAAHEADWRQMLTHRPDLLVAVQAVQGAATRARVPESACRGEREVTTQTNQPQGQDRDDHTEKTIAFVLYPGLTAFDLAGPLQVIARLAETHPEIRPMVVGERIAPMASDAGVDLIPDHTFAEAPHPYALVVPGGAIPTLRAMSNHAIRAYVRGAAETAEIIASVCSGALILASVGLLEGREATTHWAVASILESYGATYRRARWVEDDKFILSAGVSAGIDMGLQLAAWLTDEASARQIQISLDYDPQPPFGRPDYDDLGLSLRSRRAIASLGAPLLTAGPKWLTKRHL
jgi:transcriptional regulator GlxA family with amidase domain